MSRNFLKLFKNCNNLTRNLFLSVPKNKFYLLSFNKFNCNTNNYVYYNDVKCFSHDSVDCWKCGKSITEKKHPFCCSCGVVQPPLKGESYFSLFELEEDFDINQKELSQKFKHLQSLLHPDKYANKSPTERKLSADHSSLINKAYKTLMDPLNRGFYLLQRLQSKNPEEFNNEIENKIQNDADFLSEMMELNEIILEIETKQELEEIESDNNEKVKLLFSKLTDTFRDNLLKEAEEILLKLKYYDNLSKKIFDLKREKHL